MTATPGLPASGGVSEREDMGVSQGLANAGAAGEEAGVPKFRYLACGGRFFSDRNFVRRTLDFFAPVMAELICGYDPNDPTFQGADQLAYEWARDREIPVRTFPADWTKHGRSAGPRRNSQMAAERPHFCLAFEGNNGTADMRAKAERAGAEVTIFTRMGAIKPQSPPAFGSPGLSSKLPLNPGDGG